jgi:imidazole glycerol phosphate synthase glutamine amidotransferase subunit
VSAPRTEVRIVPTGIANLEAIAAAFRRLDLDVAPVDAPADIERAPLLVLPGVGSFESGMNALRAGCWDAPLRERVAAGRPTLAVCLGFQLLCEGSDEAPDVPGLGCIPGRVTRFPAAVRVPQLGWNQVRAHPRARTLRTGAMYFANSYRLTAPPAGWAPAIARYGGPFVAAAERDSVLACQFHPELSGLAGRRLLERWVAGASEVARC